jgi:hypothetical protein
MPAQPKGSHRLLENLKIFSNFKKIQKQKLLKPKNSKLQKKISDQSIRTPSKYSSNLSDGVAQELASPVC